MTLVLAVTANHYLGQRPVTSGIKRLPRKAWQRRSAGDGAKGPCRYDWTYIPHSGGAPGFQCGLLVRRSIADPTELTFYLTHAPKHTALAKLVQVAGLRWPIESLFEPGKGEVGLDQYGQAASDRLTASRSAGTATSHWQCSLSPISPPSERTRSGGGPDEPRRRTVAAHRARAQTPAVGAGQPEVTAAAHRPALVSMATETSATRPARPLAPTNTTHAAYSPAVVLAQIPFASEHADG